MDLDTREFQTPPSPEVEANKVLGRTFSITCLSIAFLPVIANIIALYGLFIYREKIRGSRYTTKFRLLAAYNILALILSAYIGIHFGINPLKRMPAQQQNRHVKAVPPGKHVMNFNVKETR